MAQLKVIKTEEITDIIDRLKCLNNYIKCALSDTSNLPEKQQLILKQKVATHAQNEFKEVSKVIAEDLVPVLESATSQYSQYISLLKVPGRVEDIPGYLVKVAQVIFGGPASQLASILTSYVEPISKLTAELQKTKTLTVPTMYTNNIINLQVPDTSIPEIKDPGGSLPSDPDTPGGPDTPSDPDTPDLSKYALKTDIPTKLSQLDNDINATSLSTVYSGLDNIFKLVDIIEVKDNQGE